MNLRRGLIGLCGLVLIIGCGGGGEGEPQPEPTNPRTQGELRFETVEQLPEDWPEVFEHPGMEIETIEVALGDTRAIRVVGHIPDTSLNVLAYFQNEMLFNQMTVTPPRDDKVIGFKPGTLSPLYTAQVTHSDRPDHVRVELSFMHKETP